MLGDKKRVGGKRKGVVMKKRGFFKGRVVAIEGSKITIDVKPETREYVDKKTGEKKFVSSTFPEPDIPKIGSVVRVIFHEKDMVEK
jgi:lipid-binding SYLF domain-containing protein